MYVLCNIQLQVLACDYLCGWIRYIVLHVLILEKIMNIAKWPPPNFKTCNRKLNINCKGPNEYLPNSTYVNALGDTCKNVKNELVRGGHLHWKVVWGCATLKTLFSGYILALENHLFKSLSSSRDPTSIF